jgi:hypothetical protein
MVPILEMEVIMPKMHLPSMPMHHTHHPVLILRTVNIQADELSEMAIIDNDVIYYCTNKPNNTSTRPQSPCPPILENTILGGYVHPAHRSYPMYFIENGGVDFATLFCRPTCTHHFGNLTI